MVGRRARTFLAMETHAPDEERPAGDGIIGEEQAVARRSIEIDSFRHANPIPAATRIGPLLTSSIVVARDPGSTTVPDSIDEQVANLFHHVGEILTAAGGDWEHVASMTFFVPSLDDRVALNGPWVEHFPDPGSRPSRHTQLADGATAKCTFTAYIT